MSRRSTRVVWLASLAALAPSVGAQTAPKPATLLITKDTKLEHDRVYGSIVIGASGIVLDGNGAWVIGEGGGATPYAGTGVFAHDVSNVKIRDLNVKGFEIGLKVDRGENWSIERCDFSDNFTDPEFGWGEAPLRGGLVWNDVARSTVRATKGNRNWNGCSLTDCVGVALEDCEFSHCTNVCLKLWHTRDSTIRNCNFSWGLRLKSGETHARDSTSVLIESGSDRNHLLKNDCTHGGDGIFVRVLNNWPSVDNVFEENDASWANNNAIESWSPGNTYLRNKANHSSYGFWLGASDKTVLIGNEAAWNGDPQGFHNAPESFGHGGIVFVNGSSSHTLVQGNWCHHNAGGGIVARGDVPTSGKSWKAFHWIIQQNRLESNRWGVYLELADWIDIGPNVFAENKEGDVHEGAGVSRLTRREANQKAAEPPHVDLQVGRGTFKVGQRVYLDASKSTDPQKLSLDFHWDLGDGTRAESSRVEHVYEAPGFYRIGLTIDDGALCSLGWADIYVVDGLDAADRPDDWGWLDETHQSKVTFRADSDCKVSGDSSVFALIDPYDGMRISLLFPKRKLANWKTADKRWIVVWLRTIDPNVPAWQDVNPIVTLFESDERFLRFTPDYDLLSRPRHNEGREGWNYFAIPLAGGEGWKRDGTELSRVNWITLGFDSFGAPPLSIWIDGLSLK